jgi:hypothetical protein
VVEILGWLGAAMVVVAYAIVSYGSVNGRNKLYQSLNIIGALLLAVNTAWHGAWPSAAVNVIWTVIALGALIPGLARRRDALSQRQIDG